MQHLIVCMEPEEFACRLLLKQSRAWLAVLWSSFHRVLASYQLKRQFACTHAKRSA